MLLVFWQGMTIASMTFCDICYAGKLRCNAKHHLSKSFYLPYSQINMKQKVGTKQYNTIMRTPFKNPFLR